MVVSEAAAGTSLLGQIFCQCSKSVLKEYHSACIFDLQLNSLVGLMQ